MTELSPGEAVYFAAVALPPAERAAYLDRACTGRDDLRKRVEQMLAGRDQVGDFLEPPAGRPAVNTAEFPGREETVGAVIAGKYKLIEEIGEGGMGAVYMAQQREPVKRVVAVKVIKAGMDSKAVLGRFEAERQALALMDHPNIARVLDAGTTDGGRPFFVMELVKGVPITKYCDEQKLTPRQRLELFVPVCHAIQHAHQKGIIHRDIKPSNVLVALYDDRPVPKVIDFGVAKAAGQSLTDQTLMTGFGAVVGTPEYMSPEQASLNNLDVDTRSDVYSLGVLLYELLTGSTPVDRRSLGQAALLEVLRIVRDVEVPRPSIRLSTTDALPRVAANRGTEPAKLSKLMKGELDWILLKALEKDRARRYETANGIAADVQRYLANEPIVARPPSTAYRLQKTWQRHRLAFLAGGAVAASLLIGIAVSVSQAVRADREARRAVAALDELRASAPAFAEQSRALAAREKFDEAIEKLDYAAKLRPDDPDYLVAKADLLECQFRFAEAAAVYRAALALRPDDDRATAGARLCDKLHAAPRGPDGRLGREDLAALYLAMQRRQRPAAELMPVARLLGEEKNHLVALWLERLKGLPVSGDKPLAGRLKVRDDGRLSLDLSDTKVADLAPLAGAPLAVLNLAHAATVTGIEPLRDMRLVDLDLTGTKVADLGPLAGMTTLERLVLDASPVDRLDPLRGLPLKSLSLDSCPVSDLSPLRGAPLGRLVLRSTRVTNLAPLAGMPLEVIDLTRTPVLDFTPLAGLPLKELHLQHNRVTDLGFVRKMPLRELSLWGCVDARNYEALTGLASLELLLLPRNYRDLPAKEIDAIAKLRDLPKLRQLGAEITDRMPFGATGPKEKFWKEWDEYEARFGPLRRAGLTFHYSQLEDGSYELNIENQPAQTDLAVLASLKDVPLKALWLNGCGVSDLTPLRALPLRVLGLYGNPVADIRPLAGLPLEELSLESTKVADLSALAGMKLKKLYLHDCKQLADVAVLGDIPTLELVTLPAQARGIDRLRPLPNLKRISFAMQRAAPYLPETSAAEFWPAYDAAAPLRKLEAMGIKAKRLHLLDDGMWDVDLSQSSLTDLSCLKGAPIAELWIWKTDVEDLSPLKGMKLRKLHLFNTRVTDLSPLKGMPLEYLNLVTTKITDIGPVAGMPLVEIKLNDCKLLTDVSPLKQCPSLRLVTLPREARDIDFLRTFPRLERLSYTENDRNGWRPSQAAAEFWKEYDGKK